MTAEDAKPDEVPKLPTSNWFDTSTFGGTIAGLMILAAPWADLVGARIVEVTGVALPVGYGNTAKTILGGLVLKAAVRWHNGKS